MGNNADELKTASLLFHNTVVRPLQELILDAIDDILAFNDISLNVFFKTLQPLELQADIPEETKEELSSDCGCKSELKDADDPCQEGYEQIGMKMKNGKKVPNCVPIENLSEDSRPFLDDKLAHEMLDALADLGEDEPEGYELVDAEIVGDDEPDDFNVEDYLNNLTELSAKQDSTGQRNLQGEV